MEKIVLQFGVIPNGNENIGGFLPAVWENGRQQGNRWSNWSYDEEDAMELAERQAFARSRRYIGDWDITISQRD